ncbi:hypothetical protein PFISCL1PPCAC_167, partial [Pristionchus fissidentatus]
SRDSTVSIPRLSIDASVEMTTGLSGMPSISFRKSLIPILATFVALSKRSLVSDDDICAELRTNHALPYSTPYRCHSCVVIVKDEKVTGHR